jgi:hypothetical protein
MANRYEVGVPKRFEPNSRQRRYQHPYVLKEASGVYWLTYSPKAKSGTGPLKTAKDAISWYQNGGR